ncbi:UDP-N-acetylmuramoyl-L-alanyl-D-glutamate--2,6-diaminopimelate ligase [uncultured Rothia sp.]|uniref:Mur ligase family protein n=1 Tax=uncultured Rothia sp. TaxID=316088 RepID=UPI0028DBD1B7|nr:UDP-N-acetylmuramoyl-L-alanyl-D-glutamate--2,6-diaminopimelate ligase [uncultured Rothia sp.]
MDTASHAPGQNLLGGDAQTLRPNSVRPVSLAHLLDTLRDLGAEVSSRPAAQQSGAVEDVEVTGISMDSRGVCAGDLYVALPGAKVHGAQFAEGALKLGAAAILTDAAGAELLGEAPVPVLVTENLREYVGPLAALIYGSASFPATHRYAVTGTNGKTTSTYMLESIFRTGLGVKTGLIGTIQILIDGVSVPSKMTTPESPHVHSLLTIMGEHGLRCAAMEVSSHAIDYHRVDGVKYAVAGFTNLTQDHLDLHGTMEHYFESKAQLFTPERAELAVITADDSWGEKMHASAAERMGAEHVHRLVTARGAGLAEVPAEFGERDWAVVRVQREGLGHRFYLENGAGESIECYTGLPADFNVSNAALAALMAYLDTDAAERELLLPALASGPALTPVVPGRMQLISLAPHAIVDFAHNPDGLTRALEAMDRPGDGKVMIVFGATGERDHLKRPIMGAIAAQNADIVIVTDDDPHGEEPAPIRAAVEEGAQKAQNRRAQQILNISPRSAAIDAAIALATEHDAILIAGRGHETEQDVDGVDIALDDRVETARALHAHGFEVLPDYRRMIDTAGAAQATETTETAEGR